MPGPLPYMRLYVADYLGDTLRLRAIENGAYNFLLMEYWQQGEPLPNDPDVLSAIARVESAEWPRVWRILSRFFIVDGDRLIHKRVEAELERARGKVGQAANAGRRSGAVRQPESEREANVRSNKKRTSVPASVPASVSTPVSTPATADGVTDGVTGSEPPLLRHEEKKLREEKKPRVSKKPEPFNGLDLPQWIFELWKAIVELRWKVDNVPEPHGSESAKIATWLYEERAATLEQFKQWVGWWFKSPDSMGSKNGGTRPWPKNVRNTWDTCFAASGGSGAAPVRKVDPDVKAKVEAERARRLAELEATVRSGGAA